MSQSRQIEQADNADWTERLWAAKDNPWLWLKDIVCTWDAHDPSTIMKPFPKKAMYRIITRAWQEYDLMFLEKSRQIMLTWIIAALDLWDALTLPGRLIFYQSKKQDDADDVIERARHIYVCANEMKVPWLPKAKKVGSSFGTASAIEFPAVKSECRAIPQGPDVVRMHTCSRILADEMNHQPEFEDGFGAAKPTIDGGGKYWAQGTANGRTFGWMQLHGIDPRTMEKTGPHKFDSNRIKNKAIVPPEHLTTEAKRRWIEAKIVDMPEEEFQSHSLIDLIACLPGMRLWKTANGITCMRVHYSADPDKSRDTEAGRDWYTKAREAYTQAQWDREMEIRYDTFEGRPVTPEFNRPMYVHQLEYKSDQILYIAADFGQSCGALFYQVYCDKPYNVRRIRWLDEIFLENSDTVELSLAIKKMLEGRFFEGWRNNNVRLFCDAAGNQTRETTSDKSMNSSIKIMAAHGLYASSKMFGVPDSVQFVQAFFSRIHPDGLPLNLVDDRCEYLIGCLSGGWHFPKAGEKARPGYPEKDGYWDHGGDMIRIGVCNVIDEFDITDTAREMAQAPYVRRKHTGEIRGRRRTTRVNSRRGAHAVRRI